MKLSDILLFKSLFSGGESGGLEPEPKALFCAQYIRGREYPVTDGIINISDVVFPNADALDGGFVLFTGGIQAFTYPIKKVESIDDITDGVCAFDGEENGVAITAMFIKQGDKLECIAMILPGLFGLILGEEMGGLTIFKDCDIVIAWPTP